ncbi:MAG: J domain-containing protein [Acidobacteriota bacterium]|nr:J domain-containing protein [Acidobacteriota bacterium]
MSYYDDMGVRPQASAEEVREAYRLLVRLLHPDQFADSALKAAAAWQMRRFNEMEAVLTDTGRRRQYDVQLAAQRAPGSRSEAPAPIIIQVPQARHFRSRFPWGSVAWGAAAMGCAAAIFWISGHEALPVPQPETRVHAAEVEQTAPSMNPEYGERWKQQGRFAGMWSWVKPRQGLKDRDFNLPESIEAQITERNGVVRGQYRSWYQAAGREISRFVNFEFVGKAVGPVAELSFEGERGIRGKVHLRLLSDHEVELAWTAAGVQGVSGGIAVLTRNR